LKRRFCVALSIILIVALGGCFERGKESPQASPNSNSIAEGKKPQKSAGGVPLDQLRSDDLSGQADPSAAITIALSTEPIHLNPMLAGDSVAVTLMMGDVYEGLLRLPKPGAAAVLGLAQRFTQSEDGKTWRFWLRPGVHFHSGAPLTPKDVLRSYQLAAAAPGPLRAEFDDLSDVELGGDGSLVFRFSGRRVGRAQAFAAVPIISAPSFDGVTPETLATAKSSLRPNGTGALRFVSHEKGNLMLSRNLQYWGTPSKSARIHYKFIPERQRLMAEFRAGHVDLVYGLPIEQALRDSDELSNVDLFRESMPAYTAAVFNTARGNLSAAQRRLLAGSLDREAIIQQLFQDFAHRALGPYPVDSERNDPSIASTPFSIRRIREELSAQWPDSATLRLLVPESSRTMRRLADIWAGDLRGVIELQVVAMPFAELLGAVRSGDFDVCLLSFTTGEDVDLYSLFHSSQIGEGNLSRLKNSDIDSILEALREPKSASPDKALYRELHRALVREAPFAFLTSDLRLGIVSEEVGGVGDGVAHWGARYLWRKK